MVKPDLTGNALEGRGEKHSSQPSGVPSNTRKAARKIVFHSPSIFSTGIL